VIRVAAVGDLHVGTDSRGLLAPQFRELADVADLLLVAGDLTRIGAPEEADVFVEELRTAAVPTVVVLGNHDHHSGCPDEVTARCRSGGLTVLDGTSVVIEGPTGTVGVAGTKGFGGGFSGTSLSAFGEQAMKDFVAVAETDAERLALALGEVVADPRPDHVVVLLHYAPIRHTLDGEPREIYPFLGCGRLAEVIDEAGADLVIHGHAHHGVECGMTPGGIPVRNVAQPVIGACYRLYQLRP
jgi:Icc-related predicted phosphoesterase